MKKIVYLLLLSLVVLGGTSCQEVEVKPNMNETFITLDDSTQQYSLDVQTYNVNFYYQSPQVQRDTVWVKILSVGAIPTKDLHVALKASTTTYTGINSMPDAVSGRDYLPFDDPSLKDLMIIRKGQMSASIPVVVLRDPSLKSQSRRIILRIADSDDVKAADQRTDSDITHAIVVIYLSDGLSQPSNWNDWFFLGAYGIVKHDFCIRHSGYKWDYDFINTVLSDYNTQTYYLYKFRNDLVQENAERAAQGLDVLTEADGTIVSFPNY